MAWVIFVVVATLSDAIRIFIDNYVSDVYFKKNGAVSQKLFYGIASVIISPIILAFSGFDFEAVGVPVILMILFAGVLAGIAGIPYYKALEIEESTNIGIFMQLAPVLYLILGWFFLGETFSPFQLVAFAFIIAAPVMIVLTTRKRSRKVKIRAVFYAFLYVLIAVIGNLFLVKAGTNGQNLVGGLALFVLGKSITNILIVQSKSKWRKRFKVVLRNSKRKVLRPMMVNLLMGTVKDFTYRAALITAPAVAVASAASDSTEPILIFFMGIVLTLIWPKFGREKLDKRTVLVHLIATVMVVTGVVLLQI